MSDQPNSLMRTRLGVGGVKLFNIPGVIYPKSMLKAAPGMNPSTGRPYVRPPARSISTVQAAGLFGILPSSVRLLLHRHKVRFFEVCTWSGQRSKYWSLPKVMRLLEKMPKQPPRQPRGTLTLAQAMEQLPCSRSTLQRHTAKGRVRVLARRQPTPRGFRMVYYYNAADVKKLAVYLQFLAIQRKERKARFGA